MKVYRTFVIVTFVCQCSTIPQKNNKIELVETQNKTEIQPIKKQEKNQNDQIKSTTETDLATVTKTTESLETTTTQTDDELAQKEKLEKEKLELERLRVEQERQEEINQAKQLKQLDEIQEKEAIAAKQRYQELLPTLKNEADRLIKEDELQESNYLIEKDEFENAVKIEANYRAQKIDKVDTERNTFYRKDSEALFKDMFTIEDVVTNGVRLFRNRKPQQYIGYRLDQKYKPVIDLVPIPTHPARRVRLYDFFKGRPGSYILLTEAGEPISIKQAGHDFTIVNIRSDGDVSIIVDLESTALQQFHRISLNDILLIME